MGKTRAKATRAERRAEPMPEIATTTDEPVPVLAAASIHRPDHTAPSSSATTPSSASKGKGNGLTKKQRAKRERGAEMAAKLEVKRSRNKERKDKKDGAKRVYE